MSETIMEVRHPQPNSQPVQEQKKKMWRRIDYSIPRRGANYTLFSFLMDMLVVFIALILASHTFAGLKLWGTGFLLMLVTASGAATFFCMGVYDLQRNSYLLAEIRIVLIALLFFNLVILGELYLLKIYDAAGWVMLVAGLCIGGTIGWRAIAYAMVYVSIVRRVIRPRRILIIGTNDIGEQLSTFIQRSILSDFSVAGFLSQFDNHESNSFKDIPVLGSLDDNIFQIIQNQRIDEVFVTMKYDPATTNAPVLADLKHVAVPVRIVPNYLDLSLYATNRLDTYRQMMMPLRHPSMTNSQRLFKRLFDIVVSSIVLLLVLPVFLVIALLIRLDSEGPIFFFQERIGENGHPFKIFKFRSMIDGADKMVQEVTSYDENGNPIHKTRNDFRVTRIGKFIRKTSLDELPQFLNVIRGDMSLVGPRPEVTHIVENNYEPWQYARFSVPQGITGWWQVNGRSEKECYRATEQDLYYIENYSLWLDVKILLMTVPALLKGKGAF